MKRHAGLQLQGQGSIFMAPNSSTGCGDQERLGTMPVEWTSWKLPAAGPGLPTLKELCLSFLGAKKK